MTNFIKCPLLRCLSGKSNMLLPIRSQYHHLECWIAPTGDQISSELHEAHFWQAKWLQKQ